MKTIETCTLTRTQKQELQTLLETGSARTGEPILAFPLEEVSRFFLLYDPALICALALILPDAESAPGQSGDFLPEAECIAYTHPDFRKKGCFSSLLALTAPWIQDRDVLFPVSPQFPDTPPALEAIGSELASTEYRMEIDLDKASSGRTGLNPPQTPGRLAMETDSTLENGFRILTFHFFPACGYPASSAPQIASGRFFFEDTPSGSRRACLCDFEVVPGLRGQGLGKEALLLMLSTLADTGTNAVFLHVSGGNAPAVALYQKTGFRISETLSYYLY